MGDGGVDLDPFWDISGFDFTVNFNSTLIEAVDVKIDPANWWLGFYPGGVYTVAKEIDNVTGRVRIAFMGIPDPSQTPPHTAPYGKGILATITFHVIYESEKYPPPSAPIWLENPLPLALIDLYSENGLINLANPVSTDWHELAPTYSNRFNLTFWEDVDGDHRLSPNDQIHLQDKETGRWLPYRVYAVPITMKVDILPFEYTDEFHEGTTMCTNAWPHPGISAWTPPSPITEYPPPEGFPPVNISLSYPAQEVHSVEVEFPNGTRRLLEHGTEWEYYPGTNQLEIKEILGTPETEYYVEDVNMTTGWEGYVPKARVLLDPLPTGWIHRIRVQFPEEIPPEYQDLWGDFAGAYVELLPWKISSGYLWMNMWGEPGWDYNWAYHYAPSRGVVAIAPWDKFPPGTEVWIDYYAQSTQIWVNYTAVEFEPRWIKSALGAAEFPFTAPLTTEWTEIIPHVDKQHVITGWTDTDGNGRLSPTDILQLYDVETGETKPANITLLATGLTVIQKPVICTYDPSCPFYGQVAIIDVAGFPHPERPMCPWHNKAYATPIPHKTEPATYTAPFKPPGRWIDLYVWGVEACNGTRWEYANFAKGLGPNEPADAIQPQAKVVLRAYVTYNFQPIAGKSVTFELTSPTGEFHIIRSAITGGWDTDLYGIAEVIVTIPWPYPDPEGRVFGQWNVTATVDIVKVVVNDTLTFRVGYLIDTVFVSPGKQTYHKGEHMSFTLTYTSISRQVRTAYFTLVVYDELGVPIAWQILGPFNVTYGTHTIVFECMEVPHWAFRYRCTAYVNALTDMPQYGGAQYCPEIYCIFAIE
jgi:hypothetical protein